jgi:adenylate cyclase
VALEPASGRALQALMLALFFRQEPAEALRVGERALVEIRQANLQKFPIYHGVAAVIYAELGMRAEATEAGARFVQMSPRFLPNLDAELAKRNIRPEDRVRLAEGLRKAGLPVPANAVTSPTGASSARSPG